MSRYVTIGLCVLLAKPAWTQETRVGELGRPDALVFEGLETFPEQEIREALARDFDVLLESHPEALLKIYLQVLEQRLIEGYHKNGFPRVKVNAVAQPERGKIQVTVEEGESFKNGEVKVEGGGEVDPVALARSLTDSKAHDAQNPSAIQQARAKNAKSGSAPTLWKPGETTNFYQKPGKIYEEAIRAGLEAQGFFFAEFDAEVRTGEQRRAHLWVHIKEAGPKATIGRITVEGHRHHSAEKIIEFLGIKAGMPVDDRQTAAWEQKLLDSHCFWEADIAVLPAIAPELPADLLVRVVEQPDGPYLGEKLTEQDEMNVKLANWLSQWGEGRSEDMVACSRGEHQSADYRVLAVVSPRKGFALDVELTSPNQAEFVRYTVLFRKGNMRLISWHRERQLAVQGIRRQLDFNILMNFSEQPADSKGPARWVFQPKFKIQNRPGGPSFRLGMKITPAAAIAAGRAANAPIRWKDGIAELAADDQVTRFDPVTGRIISITSAKLQTPVEELKQAVIPDLEQQEKILYFQAGAFERYRKYLEQETEAFPPAYNPQRPVSSVLEFVLGEAEWAARLAKKEAPIAVLVKLLQLDALEPLDRLWVEKHSPRRRPASFDLPISSETDVKFFGLENRIPFGIGRALGRLVFSLHAFLVPPESGPGRVGWNLALICAGRAREAVGNLRRLPESPEIGPMTCWYAGWVLGRISKPLGRMFAEAGLQKLKDNQFRYEMDRLLPGESLLFELVGSIGNAVRQLDDSEFAQLALLFGEEVEQPELSNLIAKLRREEGRPSRSQTLDTLTALWTAGGRDYVENRLEELSEEMGQSVEPDEISLDTLFPGTKPSKKESTEKETSKPLKLWGREFRPLSILQP